MDLPEIRSVLYSAARLRMPRRDPDAALGYNIEQIEDYLTDTAIHRGALEEARLYAADALDGLVDQLAEVEGWEVYMAKGAKSMAAEDRARALAAPRTAAGIREARRLIDRLSKQIARLEIDDKAASRRYTMMTGS